MAKVENIQVVTVRDLKLPNELYDELACNYEVNDGSYHRYYPSEEWTRFSKEQKDIINQKLKELGVIFPEVLYRDVRHPDGYFSFYILLYFDW